MQKNNEALFSTMAIWMEKSLLMLDGFQLKNKEDWKGLVRRVWDDPKVSSLNKYNIWIMMLLLLC